MGNLGQKVINHEYNLCYYPKVLVVQKTHLVHLKRSSHLNRCCIVGCLSISSKALTDNLKAKTNSSKGRSGYSFFVLEKRTNGPYYSGSSGMLTMSRTEVLLSAEYGNQ